MKMPKTKAIVKSEWRDDGKGGVILAAWAEGRLRPVELVLKSTAILDHCAGCVNCSWDHQMVTLCTPGLELTGVQR